MWEYWIFVVLVFAGIGVWKSVRRARRMGHSVHKAIVRALSHWGNSSAEQVQNTLLANYEQAEMLRLESFNQQGPAGNASLEQWFLAVKAPELFHDKSDYYLSRWEAEYASPEKADELATLKNQSDFESRRDAQIRSRIWEDIQLDPVLLSELKNQWVHALSIQTWDSFRNSSQYQTEFKKFYEKRFNQAPKSVPINYRYFQMLAAAYPEGKQAFMEAV